MTPAPHLQLPWDRFVRLSAAAQMIAASACDKSCRILQLGSLTDDLSLFLPGYQILALPFNTAEDLLAVESLTDDSFEVVVAIGDFEYFSKPHRAKMLKEQKRLAGSLCLVDFPNSECLADWMQLLEITCNSQVASCLLTGLPFVQHVTSSFDKDFEHVTVYSHTSRSTWLAFSTLSGLNPLAAKMISPCLNNQFQEHGKVELASDDEKAQKMAFNLVVAADAQLS